MITFRYYVVTLVAIFLALGLGVLAGTTFVPQATVLALKNSLDRLERRNASFIREIDSLDKRNRQLNEFAASGKDLLVRDALADVPVAIVSFDSTGGDALEQVRETFVASGARVEASIELSAKLDATSQGRREELARALEVAGPAPDTDDLRTLLADRLAGALSGRSPTELQRLVDAGFAKALDAPATGRPSGSIAPGSAIVLLAPAPDRQLRLFTERVLVPTVRSLTTSSVLVAVGEALPDRLLLTRLLRQDSSVRVVTVDGIDGPVGQAALVLGLQAAGTGRFGHYGVGEGTSGPIPRSGA
ncbi:MAG: copper transporter [Actinomycetota bacterium]